MKQLLLMTSFLLVALASFGIGRISGQSAQENALIIAEVPDTRAEQPVITLEAVRNGNLIGRSEGNAQLFVGGDQAVIDGSGAFHIPARNFFVDTITVLIPEGMTFVASKQGTRYYAIPSSNGDRILPQNRIYFKTEAEAKAAGYSAAR